MQWRSAILAAFGLTVVAIVVPAGACAATVQVDVDLSTHKIVFDAGAGEVNTVALNVVGALGDPTTYSITDSTAPLSAGPGCAGGGPPGSTATCDLPRSASGCDIRGCTTAPVSDVFEINLNDGDDSLDSTAIPAGDGGLGGYSVHGNGAAGADRFVDGPNSAVFGPGPGADSVTGGSGYDWVHASDGAPDEADLYDLGPGRDTLDYGLAAYPVAVSFDGLANDGGALEGDHAIAVESAIGGAADDVLIGSDDEPGVDELRGLGGDDRIEGGAGHDLIDGGDGNDTLYGEAGGDQMYGDELGTSNGDDRLFGGTGRDLVEGFGGADRVSGGWGSDQLTGATSVTRDHTIDRVDCGPSRDRLTYVGPEDKVRRCERIAVSR